MREYILENAQKQKFYFGSIPVVVDEDPGDHVNISQVLSVLYDLLPTSFIERLEGIHIKELPVFSERQVNALYKDNKLYISPNQDNGEDLLDDIVHEIGHHVETLYTLDIYGNPNLIKEFIGKRKELEFEIRSEGYWTENYDFEKLRYEDDFDNFLYKRIGKRMLKMMTSGLFIRPYAAVSLREYFATGFEAYFLGEKNELYKISPVLYDTIANLK